MDKKLDQKFAERTKSLEVIKPTQDTALPGGYMQEFRRVCDELTEAKEDLSEANDQIAQHKATSDQYLNRINFLEPRLAETEQRRQTAEDRATKLENDIAVSNQARFQDQQTIANCAADVARLTALYEGEKQARQYAETMLAQEKSRPVQQPIQPTYEPVSAPNLGWKIQPRRDGADKVMEYILTPIKE